MHETWKVIPGKKGYFASSLGKIKGPKKILRPTTDRSGYLIISIWKSSLKKPRLHKVHRLVAAAFLGEQPNLQINHINGIKNDNRISNLEWCTSAENQIHKNTVLGKDTVGSNNPRAKISEIQVLKIRRLYSQGLLQKEIGEKYGLTQVAVSAIIKRKVWKHV